MNNLKVFLIEHWYSRNRTDSDLAKALGVDHSLVSKWICEVVEPPLDRKIQIAKVLGIDSRLIWPEEK
jgi:transcriptional regulator with XRE-family HTH domain